MSRPNRSVFQTNHELFLMLRDAGLILPKWVTKISRCFWKFRPSASLALPFGVRMGRLLRRRVVSLWLIGGLGRGLGFHSGYPYVTFPFIRGSQKQSKPPGPKPPSQTFGCESWWFHSCDLSLVLTLHQKVQQGICVDNRFSEVGHHANEVGVPLVCNLGERPDAKRNPPYRLGGCGASWFTYWKKTESL